VSARGSEPCRAGRVGGPCGVVAWRAGPRGEAGRRACGFGSAGQRAKLAAQVRGLG
jgi:hypothetical protein